MKLALFIVIGLVALVGMMAVVGSFVPRHHVAARSARFRASAEALWRTLTEFPEMPSWAPEVTRVARLPDRNGHPVWLHVGRRWSAPMEIIEFEAPRRFRMQVADPKLPFSGSWTYEVAASGEGTVVTITEDGEIGNPLMRFLSRFVFGQTSTMDAYLKALGEKHGETVTPGASTPAVRT